MFCRHVGRNPDLYLGALGDKFWAQGPVVLTGFPWEHSGFRLGVVKTLALQGCYADQFCFRLQEPRNNRLVPPSNIKQSKIQYPSTAKASGISWSLSRTPESTNTFPPIRPRRLATHFQVYCSHCRYAVLIRRYWACDSLYINTKQYMYVNLNKYDK